MLRIQKTNSQNKEFWKILNSFLKKNKKNDMGVLYNHFENLNKNNFDDGNIDIDIDVKIYLQRWIIYLILLLRLGK